MRENIHPKWYPEARVTCSCGNTWTTGATVAELRTDVCSKCHPFFTGEQRIVDAEGQVDRFYKRLERRSTIEEAEEQARAARTGLDIPVKELGLGQRATAALDRAGITTVADVLDKLTQGGDDALLSIEGFGRQALIDAKKRMRARGLSVPTTSVEQQPAAKAQPVVEEE